MIRLDLKSSSEELVELVFDNQTWNDGNGMTWPFSQHAACIDIFAVPTPSPLFTPPHLPASTNPVLPLRTLQSSNPLLPSHLTPFAGRLRDMGPGRLARSPSARSVGEDALLRKRERGSFTSSCEALKAQAALHVLERENCKTTAKIGGKKGKERKYARMLSFALIVAIEVRSGVMFLVVVVAVFSTLLALCGQVPWNRQRFCSASGSTLCQFQLKHYQSTCQELPPPPQTHTNTAATWLFI